MKNKVLIIQALLTFIFFSGFKTGMTPDIARHCADNVIMCVYNYGCTKPAMEMTCCGQVQKIEGPYGKAKDFQAIGYENYKGGIRVYYSFDQEKGGSLFSVDIPETYYQFKGKVALKIYDKKFFEPPPGITYYKGKIKSISEIIKDARPVTEEIDELKNFKGEPGQNGSAYITWECSDSPNIIGYNLYISEESGKGYRKVNAGFIKECKYTVKKIKPGKTFYFVLTMIEEYKNVPIESRFSKEVYITAK
jgi:hypothetical protein